MSALLAIAVLSACDAYPHDIEGTSRRIAATKQLRVGFGSLSLQDRAVAQAFVDRIAAENSARPIVRSRGSTESLFADLEAGKLDMVLAEVAGDSPWLTDVTVIEPLATRKVGEREIGLSAIARNGENRWLMQLERHVRDMKGGS